MPPKPNQHFSLGNYLPRRSNIVPEYLIRPFYYRDLPADGCPFALFQSCSLLTQFNCSLVLYIHT